MEIAGKEAAARGLDISFNIIDMRELSKKYDLAFDIVIAADNSIPHLLTDEDVLLALHEFYTC